MRVRCFANTRRGLAGNVCNLHVGPNPPAPSRSDEVCCQLRLADSGPHSVSCAINGAAIQCCGHGVLAAAARVFELTGRNSTQLSMNGSVMQATREAGSDIVWITFRAADIKRADSTPAQSCLSAVAALLCIKKPQMTDAALSGGEDGYLVLRVEDGFDLSTVSPPGRVLEKHTRRALIVTSLLDRSGAIGLRYFAPQYGVEEDAATGSAMRILSAYWATRFDHLTATQYSPAGGELFSNMAGTTTRIGGRVVTAE